MKYLSSNLGDELIRELGLAKSPKMLKAMVCTQLYRCLYFKYSGYENLVNNCYCKSLLSDDVLINIMLCAKDSNNFTRVVDTYIEKVTGIANFDLANKIVGFMNKHNLRYSFVHVINTIFV